MRLIFVTLGYHPDSVGGAYRYIADLAERLATSPLKNFQIL